MKKIGFIILIMVFSFSVSGKNTAYVDSVKRDKELAILLRLVQRNMNNNIPMAVFQAESALDLALHLKDRDAVAKLNYYLGKLYGMKMSNFKRGISFYEKSISTIGETDNIEYLADNHCSLAVLYYNIGRYEKALSHLFICLDLYRSERDLLSEYFIRNFINNIYSEYLPNSYAKVRQSFSELLKISSEIKNDSLFVVTASYYTTALIAHGEFKEAEEYANQALNVTRENEHYSNFTQMLYVNLGDIFFHEGMLKAAINHYETAAEIAKRFKINTALFTCFFKLGKVYDTLGEVKLARKNYKDAIYGFDHFGMKMKLMKAYEALSLFEYKQQNLQEAFQYNLSHLALKDTLLSNQSESLVDLQSKMMMGKTIIKQKDDGISWLSINLILIVLLGVCLLGLIYLNKRRLLISKNRSMLISEKIILEKEIQNQRLQQEKLTQQLEFNAKALTINSLNMIEKNEILLQIKEKITERRSSATDGAQLINTRDLAQLVNFGLNIDKDWDNFKMHFEQVHNDFFDILKSKYPHLNSSDLKLCALLKLNLDTKEIASVMNVSPASVKVARSRLRKKLELDLTSNLSAFITQI